MSYLEPGTRRKIVAWLTAAFLLTFSTIVLYAESDAASLNKKTPKWVRNLPAVSCPGSSQTHCHQSSPAVADITGDGRLEIILATNNGHVMAYKHDGTVLWNKDVAPAFGMGADKQRIASSPAVADIDEDGKMEIVVGTGTTDPSVCTKGGVIVLNHNGGVERGWPFIAQDHAISPGGCPDTVYATPALGDLDRDGDLEIVFGGFDKRIYALHHDGKMVGGFPPNSNLYSRFGWDVLKGHLADTIWSSPSLADVNGDGYLDIVIGTDEGNFDSRWQPVVGNWNCPYRNNQTPGYCGGSVYALDRHGRALPGFPRYIHEAIQSTPILIDVDSDGKQEIFVGTGSWYYKTSPDHPTLGFKLFGFDNDGKDLAGWQGGKSVGGHVAASPAIGDITGDGKPNIVVPASDKRVYAWHLNGQKVAGFPMTPRTHRNSVLDDYNVGTSVVLADYNGDGTMEIFLRHAWEVIIINGQGHQLTAKNLNSAQPVYVTNGTILNNPAVGDLNGDGRLELVAQNSQLTVWNLPNSSDKAEWPMFKGNPQRSSTKANSVQVNPQKFFLAAAKNEETHLRLQIDIRSSLEKFNWQVGTNVPSRISFPRSKGTAQNTKLISVDVRVPAGMPLGESRLGVVNVKVSTNSGFQKTESIPINVVVLRRLNQSFLPVIR